nr:hypothetical protein [Tanacetum cinerariifolium]
MEEEENKALQTFNETPAEKADKRRKLNEEVEDLKRHIEIVPGEDDNLYTKATPLARKGRMIAEMDKDDVVVLMDDKEEDKKVEEAKDETEPAKVQEVVDVVTTAKIITEVVTAASSIIPTTEPQVLVAIFTDAPVKVATAPSRRRKRVVIRDPKEESTTSIIILAETKSKDKGKGILVEEPKPLKKKKQIEMDEEYAR